MWFLRRRESESGEEAKRALEDAENTLREVKDRAEEVSMIATDLKNIRERNHFAEQLEDLLLRRRGPLNDS